MDFYLNIPQVITFKSIRNKRFKKSEMNKFSEKKHSCLIKLLFIYFQYIYFPGI